MGEEVIQGACLCEGVKFTVQGAPDPVFICYCAHCAKNAGAPGQISAKFMRKQVQVVEGQDLLKTYVIKDTLSGYDKHKVFCSRCGCNLWSIPMKLDGEYLTVRTSLIENGLERFPYKAEFFASRKVPVGEEEIRSFATMPGY